MLAQAVLAAYEKPVSDGIHKGQLTVTGISLCPYATYLNYKHLDDEEPRAFERLRMKNGHWQEMEILEDLRKAGFQIRSTGTNQMTVHVGKVPITGRPDGLVVVDGKEVLLEIKSMSIDYYTTLKQKGLDGLTGYKTQVQLYMASEELKDRVDGCYLYAKHKDSCRPYDVFEEKDLSYSKEIITATEAIVLDGEIPRKELNDRCSKCRHRLYCWKEELLDTSGTKVVDLPETVEKWKEGKLASDYGKTLIDEARAIFREYLGENTMMLCEDLKIQRVISHRSEINMNKFVELFGANRLPEVMTEKTIESMRIQEV